MSLKRWLQEWRHWPPLVTHFVCLLLGMILSYQMNGGKSDSLYMGRNQLLWRLDPKQAKKLGLNEEDGDYLPLGRDKHQGYCRRSPVVLKTQKYKGDFYLFFPAAESGVSEIKRLLLKDATRLLPLRDAKNFPACFVPRIVYGAK